MINHYCLCIRNEVATSSSLDVKNILLKFIVIYLLAHTSPVRVLEALKFAVELCFKFKVRNFVCNCWQQGCRTFYAHSFTEGNVCCEIVVFWKCPDDHKHTNLYVLVIDDFIMNFLLLVKEDFYLNN